MSDTSSQNDPEARAGSKRKYESEDDDEIPEENEDNSHNEEDDEPEEHLELDDNEEDEDDNTAAKTSKSKKNYGGDENDDEGKARPEGEPEARTKYSTPMLGIRLVRGKWYDRHKKIYYTDEEILEKITKHVFREAEYSHCYGAQGTQIRCSCMNDVLTKHPNGKRVLQHCANALFYDYYRVSDAELSHRYFAEKIRNADAFEWASKWSGMCCGANPKKFLMPQLSSSAFMSYSVFDEGIALDDADVEEGDDEGEGEGEGKNETNDSNEVELDLKKHIEENIKRIQVNGIESSEFKSKPLKAKKTFSKWCDAGPFLCRWAFCRLHGLGKNKIRTVFVKGEGDGRKGARSSFKRNKLVGNKNSSKRYEEAHESIILFLGELQKLATPMKGTLKDVAPKTSLKVSARKRKKAKGEENEVQYLLPLPMSQNSLYRQWCYSRGWIVKYKNKCTGISYPPNQYDPRENDEYEWPVGSEPKIVTSVKTFARIWRENFPNLFVQQGGKNKMDMGA